MSPNKSRKHYRINSIRLYKNRMNKHNFSSINELKKAIDVSTEFTLRPVKSPKKKARKVASGGKQNRRSFQTPVVRSYKSKLKSFRKGRYQSVDERAISGHMNSRSKHRLSMLNQQQVGGGGTKTSEDNFGGVPVSPKKRRSKPNSRIIGYHGDTSKP